MNLKQWLDRILWALLCWSAFSMSNKVDKMAESVTELNTKLTVYISKSDFQDKAIADHETRLRKLEGRN